MSCHTVSSANIWTKLIKYGNKNAVDYKKNVMNPRFKENYWMLHNLLNTEVPFIQERCVPSSVELGQENLENNMFELCQILFSISLLSPIGNWCDSPFEQTLIPLIYIRMLCVKFYCNWTYISWEYFGILLAGFYLQCGPSFYEFVQSLDECDPVVKKTKKWETNIRSGGQTESVQKSLFELSA